METETPGPRGYPMVWAVRAVPVLIIFGALDLISPDPPVTFLVLTLVRLAYGVFTLLSIRTRRRDRLALSYVVLVFLTSLVHPVRGGELMILSTLALVAVGFDQLKQRFRRARTAEPTESAEEPGAVPGP